jgi:hypothetical protein
MDLPDSSACCSIRLRSFASASAVTCSRLRKSGCHSTRKRTRTIRAHETLERTHLHKDTHKHGQRLQCTRTHTAAVAGTQVRAHLRGSDMHRKLIRELLSAPRLVSCVQP